MDEWLELKLLVYRTLQLREQSVQDFGPHMFTIYENEFPYLLMGIELCLIISSHEQYDATRAVACWFTSGERRRRPEYVDQNKRDAE